MATFSTTYNPDQSGPQGFERGFEDYDQLEESCWYPRHTLAGIDERAQALSNSRESYEAARMDLLHDAVASTFGTWGVA